MTQAKIFCARTAGDVARWPRWTNRTDLEEVLMAADKPKAPPMRTAGKALWTSVTDAYELEEHELRLLVEAVRTVDLLDQLDAAIRRDGVLQDSPQGTRAHPAAVEARQQR